ncbi:hypothetical protein Q9L58_001660 [Maublancomyces gigas]|uniref:Uncharacterized protein n=1 Tax=Discina gigas TaxID=1032678 RepID=A0ABR3GTD2_9PEZI
MSTNTPAVSPSASQGGGTPVPRPPPPAVIRPATTKPAALRSEVFGLTPEQAAHGIGLLKEGCVGYMAGAA